MGEFLQIDIGDVAEAVLAPRERGQFLKPRMQLLLGGIKERELPLQSVDGVFRQFPRGILRRQIPARPGMIEGPVVLYELFARRFLKGCDAAEIHLEKRGYESGVLLGERLVGEEQRGLAGVALAGQRDRHEPVLFGLKGIRRPQGHGVAFAVQERLQGFFGRHIFDGDFFLSQAEGFQPLVHGIVRGVEWAHEQKKILDDKSRRIADALMEKMTPLIMKNSVQK